MTCTNFTTCQSCAASYYKHLDSDTCTLGCPVGQYIDINVADKCVACSPECAQCIDVSNKCTYCTMVGTIYLFKHLNQCLT